METLSAALIALIFLEFSYMLWYRLKRRSGNKIDDASNYPSRHTPRPSTSSWSHQDRFIYYKLQNPTQLDEAAVLVVRNRLIELLDQALTEGHRLLHSEPNILSLKNYSSHALKTFVSTISQHVDTAWLLYLQRRKAGGERELLLTRKHAEHWLECAAPVKLVDGAWLARIHRKETPCHLRPITRIAWQILSEEMGDGDLEKNHVHSYSELLRSFGSSLPAGDAADFVDARVNPYDDGDIWAAAVAQLALGLFPDDFLPEILGFNLAYEIVAFETLIAAHELRQLNLDPAYFNLHITIDNADSGHSAMALNSILKLMEVVEPSTKERTWRGIQAGFLLATTIQSTPAVPTLIDRHVLDIFSRKRESSNAAHQACRAVIGGVRGMNISAWMHDEGWDKRKYRFLVELAKSSWVVPGQPNKSRLFTELGWKGRMFGAFTAQEKKAVSDWISSLRAPGISVAETISWKDFTMNSSRSHRGLYEFKPFRLPEHMDRQTTEIGTVVLDGPIKHRTLATLIWCSLIPFENACACPTKATSHTMMTALRILRLLNGFTASISDAVDGMDEVYRPSRSSIFDFATCLESADVIMKEYDRTKASWDWLEGAAQDVELNSWFLLGSQYCFVVNILTNRPLLQKSFVEESTIEGLEFLGRKVLHQMSDLQSSRTRKYEIGYTTVLRTLQEVSKA